MGCALSSLQNLGDKHARNKMPRRFQNFSVCLGSTSAKKTTAKGSAETFVYHVGNAFSVHHHLANDYDLIF